MTQEPHFTFSRAKMIAMTTALGSSIGLAKPTSGAAAALPAPFYGAHQPGIVTPQQRHTYFVAVDVTATKREEVVALLQAWTLAAERLSRNVPVQDTADAYEPSKIMHDSGETAGLHPQHLTLTLGFGPTFFMKEGVDRFGIAHARPDALVDLPRFPGDQLIAAKTGGDISLQACADDPQVAFHAIRQLLRIGGSAVTIRWVQAGFLPDTPAGETPRNLMGFKDGTQTVTDPNTYVWVDREGPAWMRGGSYQIVRRIRIALEHWDRMTLAFQQQVVGREKASGAPLGARRETDALPLERNDANGNPFIAENAHVRLANASTNNGAQILRRGYSYNDGVDFVAERWPPWRQAMEYDAGLFFMSYQRDPRTSFIPMFEKMSRIDMLNQFATHTGSAIFACAGGTAPGEYWGQGIFDRA